MGGMQALEWATSLVIKFILLYQLLHLIDICSKYCISRDRRQAIMADLIGKKVHTMIKKNTQKEDCQLLE